MKTIDVKASALEKGDRIVIAKTIDLFGTVLEVRHGIKKLDVQKDGSSTVHEESYVIAMPDNNPKGDIPMHKHFNANDIVQLIIPESPSPKENV